MCCSLWPQARAGDPAEVPDPREEEAPEARPEELQEPAPVHCC